MTFRSVGRAVSRLLEQIIVMFNILQSLVGSLDMHFWVFQVHVTGMKTESQGRSLSKMTNKMTRIQNLQQTAGFQCQYDWWKLVSALIAVACSINVFKETVILMSPFLKQSIVQKHFALLLVSKSFFQCFARRHVNFSERFNTYIHTQNTNAISFLCELTV